MVQGWEFEVAIRYGVSVGGEPPEASMARRGAHTGLPGHLGQQSGSHRSQQEHVWR